MISKKGLGFQSVGFEVVVVNIQRFVAWFGASDLPPGLEVWGGGRRALL